MKINLVILFILTCSVGKFINCPRLSCDVVVNDNLDGDLDSDYGIGDDNLFTAAEPVFYIVKKQKVKIISGLLNDYNLQTAFWGRNKSSYDTLCIIFNFKGLAKNKKKPVILINEIDFFNGNRKNLVEWKKSKKIKEIAVVFNNKCIGETTLQNTYKMQMVKLGNNCLSIYGGRPDTLKLVIKSAYQQVNNDLEYAISEIKFSGLKYY